MKLRLRRARPDDGARAALAGLASAAAAVRDASVPPVTADGSGTAGWPEGPGSAPAAAFFDVDGTMVAGASIYYFARGLAARQFFTTRDVLAFVVKQLTFRTLGRESHAGMAEARETALAFVAGRKVADIVAFGEEIYDEAIADKIFGGTLALARQHLEAGHQVWLVTATPVELASLIARRLGLTGALGTVAASEDGVYTGRLVGVPLHGPAKAEAVQALAQREGLDLARCAAYSDSSNDLPMLSLVGHPTVVNADAELRAHAREHGWPVKEFRTGRRAARVGVPAAGGVGVVAGAVVAGVALRRRVAHG